MIFHILDRNFSTLFLILNRLLITLFKIFKKLSLRCLCEYSFPFLHCKINCSICRHSLIIDQPRTNNKQSSPSTRMTMHRYLSHFLNNRNIEQIHNPHHMLKSSRSHIFPTLIEKFNSVSVKLFRVIAEASHWKQLITTMRMLSWLLQVEDCVYILRFKFFI